MTQPTLPAEVAYTEAERNFIENSPGGLFPENQNSNFGQLRRVITDQIQACIDTLDLLYDNMFSTTADELLSSWEAMFNLPVNPAGKTVYDRQRIITSYLNSGLFTRARRREIIESFLGIYVGTGEPPSFGTTGLALTADGIPLFSGIQDISSAYTVTENVETFSYTVTIVSALTPDLVGMQRELRRVTPAHINFSFSGSTPADTTRRALITQADMEVE